MRDHWNRIYAERPSDSVSWFQAHPEVSLRLIDRAAASEARIIDIGAGASTLVDHLLAAGYQHVSVLDIADNALDVARRRLGTVEAGIGWYRADVTAWSPPHEFDLWHDRAVFHFLTEDEDRRAYVRVLRRAISPGRHAIIATFAVNGPETCSGLPVVRYDAPGLCAELGGGFDLVEQADETHVTPGGGGQAFSYFLLRRTE